MTMESREYRGSSSDSSVGGLDPGWMLLCAIMAIVLALAGFPWIILGFVAERYLSRWLHWRLSFLLWMVLLLIGIVYLSSSLQHGLQVMLSRELTDYISAAKHFRFDLLSYPLGRLWADTWPVWLRTFPGIGIAGFVAELYTASRSNTAQTLRHREQRRERAIARSKQKARKRTRHPGRLPDEVAGMMVIGIPIDEHDEEEP